MIVYANQIKYAGVTGGSGGSGASLAGDTFTGLIQFTGTAHAGLRLNNLTTAQRDAVAGPTAGMVVWNTTQSRMNVHAGAAWTDGFVRLNGDTMTGALSITGGTVTASTPVLNLTQTWNGAVTFTGIDLNVTDTASDAASLLMDLKVGGSSRVQILKTNEIRLANGGNYNSISSDGFTLRVTHNGTERFTVGNSGTANAAAFFIGGDVCLHRDNPDTFAQRRTTNAQTFRVYNTYTDASNYERGFIGWTTNELRIGSEAAGTGTLRAVSFLGSAFAFANPLTVTGGTVTASSPVLNLTQTWNDAAVTFTGIDLNVTDTASAAASLLLGCRVGGVTRFSVTRTGTVTVGSAGTGGSLTLIATGGAGAIQLAGGSPTYGVHMASGVAITWGSGAGLDGTIDLSLNRDAADTLAQRRGTNAQAFNIYNTYTDASNYERAGLAWASNVLTLRTQAAGTGSGRTIDIIAAANIRFGTTSTLRWVINNDGSLHPTPDNSMDFGLVASRIRDMYIGRNVYLTGLPTADPVIAGQLWNDSETVKISAG